MLMLIEGEHGAGKSALVAQFMKGMLDSEKRVLYITTESTIREYISKMKTITFNFSSYFLKNCLHILSLQIDGITWSGTFSKHLLPVIRRYIHVNSKKFDVVVIDSLSMLTQHIESSTIMDFFSACKHFVSNGMTVIITIHPNAVSEEVALRIRSTCDGYVRLASSSIAGRSVKVAEVVKLLGSSSQVTSQFSFDVDQTFGIKILPLSTANA